MFCNVNKVVLACKEEREREGGGVRNGIGQSVKVTSEGILLVKDKHVRIVTTIILMSTFFFFPNEVKISYE